MTTHDPDQAVRTEPMVDSRTRMLLDRRNMLRVGGLVAITAGGVALAACSPAQPSTTPSTAPSTTAPSSAAPSSAAPSSAAPSSASSAPSSAASSAPAPSGPSVAAADVPVGSGVIMDEPNNYVVTQPVKGTYKAFTSTCTHQGCRVSEMRADKIFCGCHDSEFSITDGAAVAGPAKTALEEFKTTVSGDKVYVQA